jgi:pimeloyl-ACP methyl ester carboxylesterase
MPSHFSQRKVTSSDGTTIHTESAGDASKHALVFLHGIHLSGDVFDLFFEDARLLQNFHMVTEGKSSGSTSLTFCQIRYDFRGHGQTDKPEEAEKYGSVHQAEDFQAVCEAYQIKRPTLVGW